MVYSHRIFDVAAISDEFFEVSKEMSGALHSNFIGLAVLLKLKYGWSPLMVFLPKSKLKFVSTVPALVLVMTGCLGNPWKTLLKFCRTGSSQSVQKSRFERA